MPFIHFIIKVLYSIYVWIVVIVTATFISIVMTIVSIISPKLIYQFSQFFLKMEFILLFKKLHYSSNVKLNQKGHYIFVANHGSFLDIPALMSVVPSAAVWIIKKELLQVPIMGFALRVMGCIPIDRKKPRTAMQKISVMVKAYRKKSFRNVILYPEGTRTLDGEIHAFKKGFSHIFYKVKDMAIVPVTLIGFYQFKPKNSFLFDPFARMEIIVHEPFEPKTWLNVEEKVLVEKVRDVIVKDYRR